MFGKSKNYLEVIKSKWTVVKDTLATIDPNERFLYHYWTSYKGRTSKTGLFRLMRADITDPKSALDFVERLTEGARIYSALGIHSHPFWNDYDQRTRNNLEVLTLLDVQQVLPILLAAAQIFSEDEFGKLTDILVVMTVRYNLIGELRTGVAANYYSEIPPKIRSGQINKSAKVFQELRAIYPSDDDFRDAFAKKTLKNPSRARYILGELEKHINAGVSQIVDDTRIVNLEHILPKNPSSDWSGFASSLLQEEVEEYIDRIGNLALVTSNQNRSVGSGGFAGKKKKLFDVEARIQLTRQISEYADWTKEAVDDRQIRLAEIAVKVWRIDIS